MVNTVTPEGLFKLATGFWASKTFLSAVELGVFTELAKSDADLESLRGRLGLHERSARDFLDALVALGTLDREDGIYRNTPETEMFLDRAKPSLYRRPLRDAQRSAFWILGLTHRSPEDRSATERVEGILGGCLRQALCRSGAPAHIPVGDERRERRGGTSASPRNFPGTTIGASWMSGPRKGWCPSRLRAPIHISKVLASICHR